VFLLILVLALVFASIVLIASVTLPVFSDRYITVQQQKAQVTKKKLEEMYVWVAYRKLIIIFSVSPIVLGLIFFVLFGSVWFLSGGMIFGLIAPMLLLKVLDKQRKKLFHSQLIDVLNSLSQSLKAGLSFLQAVEILVEEMPPPMSQEMAMVIKENKMGISFEESFERLNKKMDREEDLNQMTTAILVARETGGNLTDVFGHLSDNIRQKNRVSEQVKTLTTQARLQGIIMSILPIAFAFFVFKVNPTFFDIMIKSDIGRGLLLWCLISEILGAAMLLKFSKVEA
jgi:tight adherence protein B